MNTFDIFITCSCVFIIGSLVTWIIISLSIVCGKTTGYLDGVKDTRAICYKALQELKDELDKWHNCKHYKEKNK